MEFYSQKSCNTGTAIHKPECPEIKQFIYQNMVKDSISQQQGKTGLQKKSVLGEFCFWGTKSNRDQK